MFLVELSYNTIKEEIKDLDLKKNRKSYALADSSTQLEKDSAKLIQFIESDNMTTSDRNKEAELATTERKQAENKIKGLDVKIQTVKSEIDKNEDQLKALEDHKQFLFHIFETDNPKWVEDQLAERERKLQKIKRKWITEAKENKDNLGDDDQFLSEFSRPADAGTSTQTASQLGGASGQGRYRNRPGQPPKAMTDKDWEKRFEQLLKEDLIDVPEDFYDEKILFEEPEQLMQIFTNLEEKNLDIIKKSQDTEQTLEIKKQQEERTKLQIGGEIAIQEAAKHDLEQQIAQAEITLKDLEKQSKMMSNASSSGPGGGAQTKKAAGGAQKDQEEEEVNIEWLMGDLRKDICNIYKQVGDNSGGAGLDAKQSIEVLQVSIFLAFLNNQFTNDGYCIGNRNSPGRVHEDH